jgi:Uma2 family endonuclease
MPETIARKKKPAAKAAAIPDILIRDIVDGRPFYYKGYQKVVKRLLKPEDIMGASGLQSVLVMYLNTLLIKYLNLDSYYVFTSESGNHLAKNLNYGLDLAVYEATILTPDRITTKYVDVPPRLVVEVDVRVDTEPLSEIDFIHLKTQRLLEYGVKRVIWVTPATQKVLIAELDKDWLVRDWNKPFELWPGIEANVGAYLKERGIEV